MVESASSLRPLSGAEEFDRRMRSIVHSSGAHTDALAELARLVGEQDPFGSPSEQHRDPAAPVYDPHLHRAPEALADRHEDAGVADVGEEAGAPVEPAVVHGQAREPEPWERAVPRTPSIMSRDTRPIEPSPDVWAASIDDVGEEPGTPPLLTATRDAAPAEASSARRTLVVLAAVVALTGGGLAASFLAKPSGANALGASTTATPTIMAATGPSKVQPETAATGADAPTEPSTLLDKNNNDGTASAKVVNNVEQPVDLNQAIKPSAPDAAAPPPSPFPEPRKVRTVLVRPDGTIIAASSAPAPAADQATADPNQQASLAFDPKTALPPRPDPTPAIDPVAVAMPDVTSPTPAATPGTKVTTRVATPRPAASTPSDSAAGPQSRTAATTPKAKTVVRVPPKPKASATPAPEPTAVADATPPAAPTPDPDATATAAPSRSGSFAVQLGAAPTEAEASSTAIRLGQKYAGDLGSAKPGLVKAQAGGKTVYRIRVGSLSQEEAKALCGKVKSAGGGCFVARD